MNRELLQQALDALEFPHDSEWSNKAKAIEALQHALAQPEHEPVAHLWECIGRWSAYLAANGKQGNLAPPTWLVDAVKAATSQPRKEWVGLTSEDWENTPDTGKQGCERDAELFDWIEQTLKDKNEPSS